MRSGFAQATPLVGFTGRTSANLDALQAGLFREGVPVSVFRTLDTPIGAAPGKKEEPLETRLIGVKGGSRAQAEEPRIFPWPIWERRTAAARTLVHAIGASRGPSERDIELLRAWRRQPGALLLVWNDADLATQERLEEWRGSIAKAVPYLKKAKWRAVSAAPGSGFSGEFNELAAAIFKTLQRGRRLEFCAWLREPESLRARVVEDEITRAARFSAGAGAIPIIGADLLALVPLQVRLIRKIARAHGRAVTREQGRDLLALLGGGYLSRAGMRQLTKSVPVLGSMTGAAMAYSATYALGRVSDLYFTNGMSLDANRISATFKEAVATAREKWLGEKKKA